MEALEAHVVGAATFADQQSKIDHLENLVGDLVGRLSKQEEDVRELKDVV